MIQLIPGKHPELAELAAADNHGLVYPTHTVMREGQPIGYVSVGGAPMVHVWMDSQQARVWDSLQLMQHAEHLMRKQGVTSYQIACKDDSPFFDKMERLGFKSMGPVHLFYKHLTGGQ